MMSSEMLYLGLAPWCSFKANPSLIAPFGILNNLAVCLFMQRPTNQTSNDLINLLEKKNSIEDDFGIAFFFK